MGFRDELFLVPNSHLGPDGAPPLDCSNLVRQSIGGVKKFPLFLTTLPSTFPFSSLLSSFLSSLLYSSPFHLPLRTLSETLRASLKSQFVPYKGEICEFQMRPSKPLFLLLHYILNL